MKGPSEQIKERRISFKNLFFIRLLINQVANNFFSDLKVFYKMPIFSAVYGFQHMDNV